MTRQIIDTEVAIVGAGPAGLMLAHLLHRRGIASVAIDTRTREQIETTHRAGILEARPARMLVHEGVSDRILTEGYEHDGVELRFNGEGHRIDFKEAVGASVWLYPQTDVFIDLANARRRDGGDVRFGVTGVEVCNVETERPCVLFTDAEGTEWEVRPRIVVGSDGSRSQCRSLVPEARRKQYFHEYPFAWFGILCEAPMSAPELIYANSPSGFALISQRTRSVQRMYFQCDPDEKADDWSDDRIWSQLQACVAGSDGFSLKEGPIIERTVLKFRSFVQEPMRWGRLVLAGDAAHTVPPTGAKGLNLALNDVRILADVIARTFQTGDYGVLDEYEPTALRRVWRSQNFSYWFSQMMHRSGDDEFAAKRQFGEFNTVTATPEGRAYFANAYTGWPSDPTV